MKIEHHVARCLVTTAASLGYTLEPGHEPSGRRLPETPLTTTIQVHTSSTSSPLSKGNSA